MRRQLLLLLPFALLGCAKNRTSDVVGHWSIRGQQVTANQDLTFTRQTGPMTVNGTWSVKDDQVTFVPKTLNGHSISELKAQLSQKGGIPARANQFFQTIDQPDVFTLSADGKMLTGTASDPITKRALVLNKS